LHISKYHAHRRLNTGFYGACRAYAKFFLLGTNITPIQNNMSSILTKQSRESFLVRVTHGEWFEQISRDLATITTRHIEQFR